MDRTVFPIYDSKYSNPSPPNHHHEQAVDYSQTQQRRVLDPEKRYNNTDAMDTPQYCLRWNNHGSNLAGCLSRLFQKEALCDVTLVCPQQGKFQAHQTILSACSPFFEELFLEYKTPHPVVILKDYKASDIRAILEFMYLGEVNVPQSSYNEFIKTAKGLQILGLNTADNLNFKDSEDADDKDKRNNNNNESPTSKMQLPSPIVPPPIKLPHKFSTQQQPPDLERDRDERERGSVEREERERAKHLPHSEDASSLKYDRDDELDRDSSPGTPTASEHSSSVHYSQSKRKRKCDSSMTSTFNFSSASERHSESGLPLSLGSQKLSPLCKFSNSNDDEGGRRISPASNPSRIQNIKSEMSEMPVLPVLHPELLAKTVMWGSSSSQAKNDQSSPPIPPLIGIQQQPMNIPLHHDDMPKILAAQGFNSSLSDHSPEGELHHPQMDHPDGIDGDRSSLIQHSLMASRGHHPLGLGGIIASELDGGGNGAQNGGGGSASNAAGRRDHNIDYSSLFVQLTGTFPTLYRCVSCHKTVSNRWHHANIHRPQSHECPVCGQKFTRRDNMKAHCKVKHAELKDRYYGHYVHM